MIQSPPDLFLLRSSKTADATFWHRFPISDLNPWSGSTGRILIPIWWSWSPILRSWSPILWSPFTKLIQFRIHILRVGGVILTHYSTSELWCQKIFFIRHWFHLSLRKKRDCSPVIFVLVLHTIIPVFFLVNGDRAFLSTSSFLFCQVLIPVQLIIFA